MKQINKNPHIDAKGYIGSIGNRHYYEFGGFWYVYERCDLEMIHQSKVPYEILRKQYEKRLSRKGGRT